MASKLVLDAVKAKQEAEWTTVPVFYPNSATRPTADLSTFVTVEFPIGTGNPLTIDGTDREGGTVRFIVHAALKSGIDTALTYADELAALFRQAKMQAGGAVVLTQSPTSPVGLGDDGAFYRVSFSVPFTRFRSDRKSVV